MRKIILFAFLLLSVTKSNSQDNIKIEVPTVGQLGKGSIIKDYEKVSKFFISANYGLGYRTAKISKGITPALRDYVKDLKSGNSLDIEFGFRKDLHTSYSLIYSRFNSTGSIGNIAYTEPNGFQGFGSVSDNIKINFYGVGGAFNDRGIRKEDTVILAVYLGYIQYTNDVKFTNEYKITSGNIGINSKITHYFGITPSIKVGPTFAFGGSVLRKFNIEGNGFKDSYELEDDNLESLYRIDLMIGTLINL